MVFWEWRIIDYSFRGMSRMVLGGWKVMINVSEVK